MHATTSAVNQAPPAQSKALMAKTVARKEMPRREGDRRARERQGGSSTRLRGVAEGSTLQTAQEGRSACEQEPRARHAEVHSNAESGRGPPTLVGARRPSMHAARIIAGRVIRLVRPLIVSILSMNRADAARPTTGRNTTSGFEPGSSSTPPILPDGLPTDRSSAQRRFASSQSCRSRRSRPWSISYSLPSTKSSICRRRSKSSDVPPGPGGAVELQAARQGAQGGRRSGVPGIIIITINDDATRLARICACRPARDLLGLVP